QFDEVFEIRRDAVKPLRPDRKLQLAGDLQVFRFNQQIDQVEALKTLQAPFGFAAGDDPVLERDARLDDIGRLVLLTGAACEFFPMFRDDSAEVIDSFVETRWAVEHDERVCGQKVEECGELAPAFEMREGGAVEGPGQDANAFRLLALGNAALRRGIEPANRFQLLAEKVEA